MNNLVEAQEKAKKKKIIILCIVVGIITIGIGGGVAIKFGQTSNKVQASDEKIDENNDAIKELPKYDNGGYLKLEDDPNADDALVVAETLDGLLKGKRKFPVREDGKKVVYLTFDDGPSTNNTPGVLEVLKNYDVKGTFFTLGKSIEANDEAKSILKKIASNGHAIANHTYGHDYKYLYPNKVINVDNVISDVEKNNELLRSVLGKDFSTRVIRFPGGYWSWEGRTPVKEAMISKGYCNIEWNALNEDSHGPKKDEEGLLKVTKEKVENLGEDADMIVFLMHDTYGKEETVKALPKIIEYFKSKGFEFRTIK